MGQKRTEASSFESSYGGGFISAGQYLAEILCERQAGGSLPLRFWDEKTWKRKFLLQVRLAARLLQTYSITAILRALRTARGKQATSLGSPFLKSLMEDEQKALSLPAAIEPFVPQASVGPENTSLRGPFIQERSLLSKLKGL